MAARFPRSLQINYLFIYLLTYAPVADDYDLMLALSFICVICSNHFSLSLVPVKGAFHGKGKSHKYKYISIINVEVQNFHLIL